MENKENKELQYVAVLHNSLTINPKDSRKLSEEHERIIDMFSAVDNVNIVVFPKHLLRGVNND